MRLCHHPVRWQPASTYVAGRRSATYGLDEGVKHMGNDEMPYAGIASFLKAPYVPHPTPADGEVAVLGIPYDEGTTNRSGARMGPRALREASTHWTYRDGAAPFYDCLLYTSDAADDL